jgi:MFS family permease
MQKKKLALQFILLLGLVSLFGDIAYEGARSVVGPFLAILGASASMVGLITGFGEFAAYAFRLFSGYLGDQTKKYWLLTIIGYALIFSIPLLAFTGYWQVAAILIIIERIGKGIRSPARDTILSHATKQVGRGFGFGIHEALDQVGAIIGPLIFSLVFFLNFGYSQGFLILFLPVILALAFLLLAKQKVPSPEKFEVKSRKIKAKLQKIFGFTSYSLF